MASIELDTSRGRVVVVDAAAVRPDDEERPATLLDAVKAAGLPLAQSCRGEGVCRSCAVEVERGAEALPPLTRLEVRFGFGPARRLACQVALPTGSARVRLHHAGWGRPPPSTAAPGDARGPGSDDTLER